MSVYVGEWGEERGRCEVKVIGFTFLKDHCGSCLDWTVGSKTASRDTKTAQVVP